MPLAPHYLNTAYDLCDVALTNQGKQATVECPYSDALHLYNTFAKLRRNSAEDSLYLGDAIEEAYKGWGFYARLAAKVYLRTNPALISMIQEWIEDDLPCVQHLTEIALWDEDVDGWIDARVEAYSKQRLPAWGAQYAKFVVFDTNQVLQSPSLIPFRACIARVDTDYTDVRNIRNHIFFARNKATNVETQSRLLKVRCFADSRRENKVSVMMMDPVKIIVEDLYNPPR